LESGIGGYMEWIQLAILLVLVIGLSIWQSVETKANERSVNQRLEENRKLLQKFRQEKYEVRRETGEANQPETNKQATKEFLNPPSGNEEKFQVKH
jgi:hypothetical protein